MKQLVLIRAEPNNYANLFRITLIISVHIYFRRGFSISLISTKKLYFTLYFRLFYLEWTIRPENVAVSVSVDLIIVLIDFRKAASVIYASSNLELFKILIRHNQQEKILPTASDVFTISI